MSACGICKEKLPDNGNFVSCRGCDKRYHFRCTTIRESTYRNMSLNRKESWRCASCKVSDSDCSDGRRGSVSENVDFVKFEQYFTDLKNDIEKSQNFLSDQIDDMKKQLDQNQDMFRSMKNTIDNLVKTVKEKDEIIFNLENKINKLDQYQRKNNFELTNIVETKDEVLEDIVVRVAEKMEINLQKDDIDAVHRLPARKGKVANVIVQLVSRRKRDEFITKKKNFNITNNDISGNGNNTKVYVNENLSPHYKQLLWKTKEKARDKNYAFVWFANGKILVRKEVNAAIIRVVTERDLDMVK